MGIILQRCREDDNDNSCQNLIGLGLNSFRASIVATALLTGSMLLIAIAYVVSRTYGAPMVRLRSTGYPPNLELPQSCENHLFVSHVWSSGQDKAHTITRNLQLYGPGIKIWIDVDSLQDIDRLEDDIVESAVVLIFYTTGYFQSVNCRREFLSSDSA